MSNLENGGYNLYHLKHYITKQQKHSVIFLLTERDALPYFSSNGRMLTLQMPLDVPPVENRLYSEMELICIYNRKACAMQMQGCC